MRRAVENFFELGMPTNQSIHGNYKLFPSPPIGGRGQGEGGMQRPLKPPLTLTLSPRRGEGI